MNFLANLFGDIENKKPIKTKEEAIEILKISPELFESFERTYKIASMKEEIESDNLYDKGKGFFDRENEGLKNTLPVKPYNPKYLEEIINRIVDELLLYPIAESEEYKNGKIKPVTIQEIMVLPEELRPQLTGTMVIKDIARDSYPAVLFFYNEYLKANDPKKKSKMMLQFMMGLDTLDLDPITYAILGENSNTFGKWYPQLEKAISNQNFFKLPKTKYIKVPLPILQLTRMGYNLVNQTTKEIVNRYCMKAFNLDINKDYFIKTGTFSYKFDFRNCKVTKGKEVTELGEYLLYINSYAVSMASMLSNKPIVGVSTTNEWVVREYINDVENNPTIYKGLPLHTEYRIFIDADTKEVIGKSPYWDVDVLSKRFAAGNDRDKADMKHDYIAVQVHKETLEKRYNENIDKLIERMKCLINDLDLNGQWSVDIMQNGEDFYIIDMALAKNSAYYDCVPLEKRREIEEDWIPKLEQ